MTTTRSGKVVNTKKTPESSGKSNKRAHDDDVDQQRDPKGTKIKRSNIQDAAYVTTRGGRASTKSAAKQPRGRHTRLDEDQEEEEREEEEHMPSGKKKLRASPRPRRQDPSPSPPVQMQDKRRDDPNEEDGDDDAPPDEMTTKATAGGPLLLDEQGTKTKKKRKSRHDKPSSTLPRHKPSEHEKKKDQDDDDEEEEEEMGVEEGEDALPADILAAAAAAAAGRAEVVTVQKQHAVQKSSLEQRHAKRRAFKQALLQGEVDKGPVALQVVDVPFGTGSIHSKATASINARAFYQDRMFSSAAQVRSATMVPFRPGMTLSASLRQARFAPAASFAPGPKRRK